MDFAKAEKMLAFNMPAMMCAINVCLLAIAWIGAKAIIVSGNTPGIAGGMTTGELMSLFFLCNSDFDVSDDDFYGICNGYHRKIFCRAYR